MKKFLILTMVVGVLASVACMYSIGEIFPSGMSDAELYIANKQDGKNISMTICGINPPSLGKALKAEQNVLGFGATYPMGATTEQAILAKCRAKVVQVEVVGDIIIYYAYSSKLGQGVNIDGKRVNLQIATDKNKIKIGSPLIMGSY